MNNGKYVFAQVMEYVHHYQFDQCVARFRGEKYVKKFSCREQFLAMAFGQLAYRESLRDIVTCLFSQKSKLYHLGFKKPISRSTLSDANEKRDWNIYWNFAQYLIKEAKTLYANDQSFTLDLENACYAVDSTSIELCLSMFPSFPYMETKAAVKLHVVMDMRGSIPTFFDMTSGKVNDMNFLDNIIFEKDAFYVLDRDYLDFGRLYALHKAGAFFVTRTKYNTRLARRYSNRTNSEAIRYDQIVFLTGINTKLKYPDTLRRIRYYDGETDKIYIFLTNNMIVDAQTIADLYKHRWQVELFFKWIKQHLKIKVFWGRSKNAVKTQICIALCAYLIVAIIKKRLGIERNIYEILQILSVSLFDKTPLVKLFSVVDLQNPNGDSENMASLFDF
ncbi:MAG: IS4 family transposase [Candidatus Roizmanbacteria bacterium]|nr:IS4 family transposase [Candidatus Roizmanbacteria bacterium]